MQCETIIFLKKIGLGEQGVRDKRTEKRRKNTAYREERTKKRAKRSLFGERHTFASTTHFPNSSVGKNMFFGPDFEIQT